MISAFFLWREYQHNKMGENRQDRLITQLLKQIADLDIQYEAGDIAHDIYQAKRAKLKKQVTQLMQTTGYKKTEST